MPYTENVEHFSSLVELQSIAPEFENGFIKSHNVATYEFGVVERFGY